MAIDESNASHIEIEPENSDEDDKDQSWDDWRLDENSEEEELAVDSELICLFCDSVYGSSDALFEHCLLEHRFDFNGMRSELALDFYGCFKLINYVRAKVAENKCWSCGIACQSKEDLRSHLHGAVSFSNGLLPWSSDEYLKPFLNEDALLYSFGGDDEGEDDEDVMSVDKKELLKDFEQINFDEDESTLEIEVNKPSYSGQNGGNSTFCSENSLGKFGNDIIAAEAGGSYRNTNDEASNVYLAKVAANKIKDINKNYFGGYSSYGIHRDMISDKVRTDAYRQAILENPSLVKGATVMDVGCGTGILSLFAAQAGASRVIAVEASEKMAATAAQIAKDNGFLWTGSEVSSQGTGVMEVVQGMVEEIEKSQKVQPHSVDVLVSEWMGYCLLYESMLSSVLYARDRFLKPGGAVLPDLATMFVAGFGRGGTSIPFWENVYGFNMSCIGKELVTDASKFPIVDVIDSCDVITNSTVLQKFDLMTMKPEEMDFTAKVELELKGEASANSSTSSGTLCYGVVLWFETGFTERFCKEKPTNLSTSPFTPSTHWSQTVLTFSEPIAMMSSGKLLNTDKIAAVGTDACPAVNLQCRISVVRATQHRSIDISMELSGIGPCGRKRHWPAQLFNLL